jgi:hypothetical protein
MSGGFPNRTPHVNPRAENIPLFKLIQMNTPEIKRTKGPFLL